METIQTNLQTTHNTEPQVVTTDVQIDHNGSLCTLEVWFPFAWTIEQQWHWLATHGIYMYTRIGQNLLRATVAAAATPQTSSS